MEDVQLEREAFERDVQWCFRCGDEWRRNWPLVLDIHEIVSGGSRQTALRYRQTWLRLCRRCHDEVQTWPIAAQYALKRRHDPDWYDRRLCNELRGREAEAVTEDDVDQSLFM